MQDLGKRLAGYHRPDNTSLLIAWFADVLELVHNRRLLPLPRMAHQILTRLQRHMFRQLQLISDTRASPPSAKGLRSTSLSDIVSAYQQQDSLRR